MAITRDQHARFVEIYKKHDGTILDIIEESEEMTATEQILKTEIRLQHTKRKRAKVQEIILIALRCAINDGLRVEDGEFEWVGSRKDYVSDLLDIWLEDEDGKVATDRLVNLIIY